VPATDSGDDFVRIGFPDERFGIAIMFADKAIDGGLQIDDGMWMGDGLSACSIILVD
jgi:hypothetical protein